MRPHRCGTAEQRFGRPATPDERPAAMATRMQRCHTTQMSRETYTDGDSARRQGPGGDRRAQSAGRDVPEATRTTAHAHGAEGERACHARTARARSSAYRSVAPADIQAAGWNVLGTVPGVAPARGCASSALPCGLPSAGRPAGVPSAPPVAPSPPGCAGAGSCAPLPASHRASTCLAASGFGASAARTPAAARGGGRPGRLLVLRSRCARLWPWR